MPSENDSIDDLHRLKIEDELPLKAIGIENLREANPNTYPPHRYLFPWFARRPTPASRLSILASVLPDSIDNDSLLQLMQIGPNAQIDGSVEDYVEAKKMSESSRDGSLNDHYEYPRPYTQTPSKEQLGEFHDTLRDVWGGELPTILDATAGGGVIPFESLRYGLPTKANELNPVPSLMLKVMLEYAPSVGSLQDELKKWGDKINKDASEELQEYFPAEDGFKPSAYPATYVISCSSCGTDMPLVPKWWLKKKSATTGVAVRPRVNGRSVDYEVVHLPDDCSKSEFNPNEGPISRGGDAECLSCGVVTDSDSIKESLRDGEYQYELLAVKYEDDKGGTGYREVNNSDQNALEQAESDIESDLELLSLLSSRIPEGKKTRELRQVGMVEWRDLFSPRQFISHAAYLQAFKESKTEIRQAYDAEKAEAILTILSLVGTKVVNRNSRVNTWDPSMGIPDHIFRGNNFAFKRLFCENNPSVEGAGSYPANLKKIIDSYEEIARYVQSADNPAEVISGDAENLPIATDSIQAAVVDPPYYDSVMYAELSDVFYVWLKEYLSDVHPDQFSRATTNKQDEAVANSSKFDGELKPSESKRELAKDDYETKMSQIFSELYRVIEPGGAMTVMFTHKENDAWDTLTMSLINSGFVVSATHPITSEMPQREGMRENNSADSTILLTGRKPHNPTPIEERLPSLWSEVEDDFQRVAREKAEELLESGLSMTKTDIIIGAFGPTLRTFTEKYPVVDDAENPVAPEKALEAARTAVTNVLAERFLDVSDEFDDLRGLTKWYVLSWLVHESDTLPYDDGRQLGVGVGVYVDDIKKSTKIWGKKSGDIQLKASDERVRDILKLEDVESGVLEPDSKKVPTSRKYPVDPREDEFEYAIDSIHAAFHVYDHKGARYAENWLRERHLHSDEKFKTALKALMDVLPNSHPDAEIGKNLLAGKTGDLLDIDTTGLFKDSRDERQTKTDEWSGDGGKDNE